MRIKSGIDEFDELVDGGIPEEFVVLLTGEIGTGKTIFGLQFLCSAKEPGVYVSFEETLEQLRETAKMFGWDIEGMERDKKIRLIKFDPYRLEDIIEIVENNVREIKAKRVVIDSVSALGIYLREIAEIRRLVLQMGGIMKKSKATALLISEVPKHGMISRFGVEEFVADGVVLLQKDITGNDVRKMISVPKMRMTNHSRKLHQYDIAKKGVEIKPSGPDARRAPGHR